MQCLFVMHLCILAALSNAFIIIIIIIARLKRGANDLHIVQLMPLPPYHLCFRKSRMVYPSGTGLPRLSWKRPLNNCMCVLLGLIAMHSIRCGLLLQMCMVCLCPGHDCEHYKTGEPIEMPFCVRTCVSPKNHVLHWCPIPHGQRTF